MRVRHTVTVTHDIFDPAPESHVNFMTKGRRKDGRMDRRERWRRSREQPLTNDCLGQHTPVSCSMSCSNITIGSEPLPSGFEAGSQPRVLGGIPWWIWDAELACHAACVRTGDIYKGGQPLR